MRLATTTLLALSLSAAACDGGSDRPSKGKVTVRVLEDGIGLAGVDVVFHGKDGEVLAYLATGSDGTASYADTPRGGIVTVARDDEGGDWDLDSVGGVEPGDEIVFSSGGADEDVVVSTLEVTISPFAGAARYDLLAGCTDVGIVGTSGEMEIRAPCVDQETIDLVALAYDDDDAVLAHAVVRDHPVATTSVGIDDWSTDTTTVGYAVEEIDGDVFTGFGTISLVDAGGEYRVYEDEAAPVGDRIEFSGPMIAGFGASAVRSIAIAAGTEDSLSGYAVVAEGLDLPLPASDALPYSEFLPILQGLTVDTSQSPVRPTLAWTDVSLGGADALTAIAEWDEGETRTSWAFTAPPSSGSDGRLRFPQLPPELLFAVPTGIAIVPAITLIDVSVYGGFQDLKDAAYAGEETDFGEIIPVGERFRISVTGDL